MPQIGPQPNWRPFSTYVAKSQIIFDCHSFTFHNICRIEALPSAKPNRILSTIAENTTKDRKLLKTLTPTL